MRGFGICQHGRVRARAACAQIAEALASASTVGGVVGARSVGVALFVSTDGGVIGATSLSVVGPWVGPTSASITQ